MIEVEKRSFITKEKYDEIVLKLKDNILETNQITYYFKGEKDFRLMHTKTYSKLWLKSGEIHDDAREEVEVYLDEKETSNTFKLLKSLGYEPEIIWFRSRKECDYKEIKITIDYTIGYGYIFEVEKLIEDDQNIEEAKSQLDNLLKEFNIEVSAKSQFSEKYEDYKINWRKYTEDIDIKTFLN